jgi:hypothetical protein
MKLESTQDVAIMRMKIQRRQGALPRLDARPPCRDARDGQDRGKMRESIAKPLAKLRNEIKEFEARSSTEPLSA